MKKSGKRLGSAARVLTAVLALMGPVAAFTGCSYDHSNPPAGPTLRIQTGAAPVSGARCSLSNSTGKTLAVDVMTAAGGAAIFTEVVSAIGLALVSCSGGSYTDLASGRTMTATRLRSYATVPTSTTSSEAAMVTPLTELAVRLLGSQNATTQ